MKRGFLGIRSQLVEISPENQKVLQRDQASGLLLAGVEDGSPAASSDLMVGDIIVGFNGQAAKDHDELLGLLSGDVVGQSVPVEVLRGGKRESIEVTVGEREVRDTHGRSFRHHRGRRFWRGPWGWRYRG